MADSQMNEDAVFEMPVTGTYIPPSIDPAELLAGNSYTHYSPVPPALLPPAAPSQPGSLENGLEASEEPSQPAQGPPCVLGVDEAGRGPVLGPMVYGVFYLPVELSDPLLRDEHHFDDSKVLTPAVRSSLMQTLCTPSPSSSGPDGQQPQNQLHAQCGWATAALSARDISAGMLRPGGASGPGPYNLNAQAMDATVALIQGVFARGVNVREIYVDTIGQPAAYQRKLERVFPATKITVAKKADSLYPCVSAASVCAKVTRDAALEVLYTVHQTAAVAAAAAAGEEQKKDGEQEMAWGSGYPSDARCANWLKGNIHPVFGWGPECRFSWSTAKDMLEAKDNGVRVDWPEPEDGETMRLTEYFTAGSQDAELDELGTWFGTPVGQEAF